MSIAHIYNEIPTAALRHHWNLQHQQPLFDLRVEKRGPTARATGHVCTAPLSPPRSAHPRGVPACEQGENTPRCPLSWDMASPTIRGADGAL